MATTGGAAIKHRNPRSRLTSSRYRAGPRTTPLTAFESLIPDPRESLEIRCRAATADRDDSNTASASEQLTAKRRTRIAFLATAFSAPSEQAPYHFAATTDGLMNTIGMAPGEQRQRVASCTTAARANATCSTTVSWPAPLADANYTASCTLDEPSHPAFCYFDFFQSCRVNRRHD